MVNIPGITFPTATLPSTNTEPVTVAEPVTPNDCDTSALYGAFNKPSILTSPSSIPAAARNATAVAQRRRSTR